MPARFLENSTVLLRVSALLTRGARHAIVDCDECASSGDSRVRLRRALEEYARDHPNASDTPAGICGWWIPSELRPTERDLEAVLDALVADGVLQRTVLIDRAELYSVRSGPAEERDED